MNTVLLEIAFASVQQRYEALPNKEYKFFVAIDHILEWFQNHGQLPKDVPDENLLDPEQLTLERFTHLVSTSNMPLHKLIYEKYVRDTLNQWISDPLYVDMELLNVANEQASGPLPCKCKSLVWMTKHTMKRLEAAKGTDREITYYLELLGMQTDGTPKFRMIQK